MDVELDNSHKNDVYKKNWWKKIIGDKMTTSGWLSFIVMGAGQFKNKQYGKGIFFFVFQTAYLITEIFTSKVGMGEISGQPESWGYGFLRRGLWGFITLGEATGGRFRDNSPVLMIEGLIAILFLLIYLFFWFYNIRDANKTYLKWKSTKLRVSSVDYFKHLLESSFAYVVSGPALILLLFVSILPILFAFFVAFTNYDAYHTPPAKLLDWVGFKNFIKIIKLPGWRTTFAGVASWNIIWAFLSTITTFFGGLSLAIVVNNHRVKFKRFWRTILIFPWAIPGMVSLLVFNNFFNQTYGPVNKWLNMSIPWLNDPLLAKITIIGVNFWLGVPYFMMLMTGLLTSFDETLFDAAKVDGASKSQTFWYITFPILMKQVLPLLIMSFAANFNNFGAIYFLTKGAPRNIAYEYAGHTDLLITWIYKMTVDFRMYNMASIMSIIIFLVIGSISLWNFIRTDAFKED